MDRRPVVAGQFYPGNAAALRREVEGYLARAKPPAAARTILAMVPHAGYVYSGAVAGATLGAANLAETVLLLGPNHTGRGHPLAVWPDGTWSVPGCALAVDAVLAGDLLAADPHLSADQAAHLQEHSLEVVLPFLCALSPETLIVPVAVAERNPKTLIAAAGAMAAVLKARPGPVSIVVSSDMSHYLPVDVAKRQDSLALEKALALDPLGLYATVREEGITMCGVLPMTLGLALALKLGAKRAELAAYATSGDVSGDFSQVVGYAGVLAA